MCIALGEFRLGPISLALADGDYLAIMGPGGCGKTTLLRTIAGILRPAAGEIHIGGRRVDDLPSYRRGVGYVPQHSLLFPHRTVADNVRFGLRYADGSQAERQSPLCAGRRADRRQPACWTAFPQRSRAARPAGSPWPAPWP